jgi:beta-galactosidase
VFVPCLPCFRGAVTCLLLAGAALVIATPCAAQRQRMSMDLDWRFMLGDPTGAERASFDDRGWRRVDLPHDWSIEGTPSQDAPGGGGMGYFPGGLGWYRRGCSG